MSFGDVDTFNLLFDKLQNLLNDSQGYYESFLDANNLYKQGKMSDKEFFESAMRTIESQESASSKAMILSLLKEEKFGQAIACINAIQRATIRALNGAMFNPFYADLVKPDAAKID